MTLFQPKDELLTYQIFQLSDLNMPVKKRENERLFGMYQTEKEYKQGNAVFCHTA